MDSIFFQPTLHGVTGLVLYLLEDYRGAAAAYRRHYREAYLAEGPATDVDGSAALLRGDLDVSKDLALQALTRDPRNITALLNLAEIALHEGLWSESTQLLQRAEQEAESLQLIDQDSHGLFDAHLLRTVVHTRESRYDEALKHVNLALRDTKPRRLTTWLWTLEVIGELRALSSSEQPACLLAHYYRFLRLVDGSRGRVAVSYAERAIARQDHPSEAHYTIAILAYRDGDLILAHDAVQRAIEAHPKNAQAYSLAASIYSDRGDLINEYRMREAEFRAASQDQFHLRHVINFLIDKAGDYYQALVLAHQALEKTPQNVEALWRAGHVYSLLGEHQTALEYYRQGLVYQPDNPNLHYNVASVLVELGRREEAIAAYSQTLSLDPARSEAHRNLGYQLWAEARFSEALAEFQAAVRWGERGLNTFSMLCQSHDRLGQYKEAEACYDQILAADPGNRIARMHLTHIQRNLKLRKEQ